MIIILRMPRHFSVCMLFIFLSHWKICKYMLNIQIVTCIYMYINYNLIQFNSVIFCLHYQTTTLLVNYSVIVLWYLKD